MHPISKQQVDALRPFLDHSQANGAGRDLRCLMQTLYEEGWIKAGFDWGEWQDVAEDYVSSPTKLASVDLETIQKLFTTHARKDRFAEGHWDIMIQCGHIQALLQRAAVLGAEL
jgi:hypothetical protein